MSDVPQDREQQPETQLQSDGDGSGTGRGKKTAVGTGHDGRGDLGWKTRQAMLAALQKVPTIIGSVVVGHDGILISSTMAAEMDALSIGMCARGIYLNTDVSVKRMGHHRVHQIVARTSAGYFIICDFGEELVVVVLTTRGPTSGLIDLMRNITKMAAA